MKVLRSSSGFSRPTISIPTWHRVTRDWEGETAFIVGGGTSVLTQDVELLRGRKVIVINSSYERVPFADYLVYCDPGWWQVHKTKVGAFDGRIVVPIAQMPRCSRRLFLRKRNPPGLTSDPTALAMRWTTFTAAINLAVHLGAKRIVLLGADGKMGVGVNGRPLSHHYTPHVWWKFKAGRWNLHRDELRTLIKPLSDLGVDVVNASPGSAWDMWPIVTLEQAVATTCGPMLEAACG